MGAQSICDNLASPKYFPVPCPNFDTNSVYLTQSRGFDEFVNSAHSFDYSVTIEEDPPFYKKLPYLTLSFELDYGHALTSGNLKGIPLYVRENSALKARGYYNEAPYPSDNINIASDYVFLALGLQVFRTFGFGVGFMPQFAADTGSSDYGDPLGSPGDENHVKILISSGPLVFTELKVPPISIYSNSKKKNTGTDCSLFASVRWFFPIKRDVTAENYRISWEPGLPVPIGRKTDNEDKGVLGTISPQRFELQLGPTIGWGGKSVLEFFLQYSFAIHDFKPSARGKSMVLDNNYWHYIGIGTRVMFDLLD